MWGILGQNGCGKTTLLQAFAGLHPLAQGDIFLGEHKLKNLAMKTIAQTLGILFQECHTPFPQTVWDYCIENQRVKIFNLYHHDLLGTAGNYNKLAET